MLDVSAFYYLETLYCISSLEMYFKCSNVAAELFNRTWAWNSTEGSYLWQNLDRNITYRLRMATHQIRQHHFVHFYNSSRKTIWKQRSWETASSKLKEVLEINVNELVHLSLYSGIWCICLEGKNCNTWWELARWWSQTLRSSKVWET